MLKVNEGFTSADLQWENCVGVLDGVVAMLGKRAEFVTKVQERANEQVTFTHCMIHKETITAKQMSP